MAIIKIQRILREFLFLLPGGATGDLTPFKKKTQWNQRIGENYSREVNQVNRVGESPRASARCPSYSVGGTFRFFILESACGEEEELLDSGKEEQREGKLRTVRTAENSRHLFSVVLTS